MRSGTILALCCDCAAPLGLNKYAITNNPGLAPWAMQEYRPKGLLYVCPINILYYFGAVARFQKRQVLLVLLWGFAEYGNRKALRLKAQGVYSCK